MKEYQSADIRNIALVGHGATGKTMIAESMLACSGIVTRLGHIASKNTFSDYHEDEQEHQHSIYASLLHAEWKDKKINIVDAPGYSDFIGEALGALRVADLAVIVIHAEHGIELGTENTWDYATHYDIPKLFIVNALDKDNVKFDHLVDQIKGRFGTNIFPIMLPVNTGSTFNKILDVVNKKIITYKTDESGHFDVSEASGEWRDKAQTLHNALAEAVAESDDTLLEKFFAEGALSDDEMRKGLHKAFQNQSVIPLCVTAGDKNIGVAQVMDFVALYGSSPLDRPFIKALDVHNAEVEVAVHGADPSLFIFKTVSESRSGGLSFFKVFSGDVKPGLNLYNAARRATERVGQLFSINGKNRDQLDVLHAGDIGAVAKLRDTHTNNTLCNEQKILMIPAIAYPHPNIRVGIRSKSKGDEEKLSVGLATLKEEDPTFEFKVDPELHQMLIAGQGELHLETCVSKLRHRFGLEIETFAPRIPYRETIKSAGDAKYRHKKQSGGAGQFAEVWMRVEPKSHDEEVEFTQSLVGQNVDRVFVPSVEKGVKAAVEKGVLAGYRVVGVKVDFYDGKQHPVDSKDIAFQIAGKFAFREAIMQAKPCLLEPIMNLEVKVPDEFTGNIMSDVSGRRGRVLGMETEGKYTIIKAQVPQAELYRYSTTLRSLVGGRGIHIERFDHYAEMPHELEQKIVELHKKEKDDEE
ncbi:TPA: elongation factor G [Candidatus Dependentiae bacterium]|nr:MAG: Small GTP-binding protein [candidate division TM6 bacterium GW2011_GWF2_36_131]KKQ02764.1 MAG: Small GTP-binding protein [candidate division TM6 bacterium GW2011_GWE2_36_25]KKQ19139.1 MAG: Small GTP-binding protein [candidate division TM6 bacterium GW2011_GWA2_36_9]HBR70416.1 elongation factor G [Candidatus Dependentiae bacterium]HCU01147.1 elongation factor G [Candidatus Dependentiae bacterium]